MEDASLGEALKTLKLENADGEAMTYESHRVLELERRRILAAAFPECGMPNDQVVAISARDSKGAWREFIAVLKDPADPSPTASLVMGSCAITYEDLSPSECIEYSFAEDPSTWALAQISLEALENYRGQKFEHWKSMLTSPTCEAQFRRMLQIGIVARLYDSHVFPTPESQKSLYQVTDEKTGKLIELPHPVAGLRVWDASKSSYQSLDPQLTGAPSEAEKSTYWTNLIQELKVKLGDEYVSSFVKQ
jgi:hypothetical protein